MAYAKPKQWVHGDQPTATDMNKYSDSLNSMDSAYPQAYHVAVPKVDTETLYMVHRWRWLHYISTSGSTATIADVAGVEDDVTIADAASMTGYDLDTISWMVPGKVYTVTNVDYVVEDWEA